MLNINPITTNQNKRPICYKVLKEQQCLPISECLTRPVIPWGTTFKFSTNTPG